MRGAAAVVAAAALALGGAACRRGDREIRDGFTAAFDAPPVVAVSLDMKQTLADVTLSAKELGYAPKVTMQEGMRRFADWWRALE